MVIEFDGTRDPTGFEVYDPIEQRRLQVRTPEPVTPVSAPDEQFCFPVDTACTIVTESLVFDQRYYVDVHDADGRSITSLQSNGSVALGDEAAFVGLSGPIKLYCRVTAPGELRTGIDSVHVDFEEPTEVSIGARSPHEQPAATITTPDDPEAMMRAVSAMSSALKTTSPERSWPTLRGHPPLIERGTDLEIPSVLSRPETDVAIEVPETYRDLYTVAPLSFYLGAEVRPGAVPRVVTDVDTYDLGVGTRLEDDVARTLKRVFLLDCLVRTEGLYRYDIAERTALEDDLPFDLAETYEASMAERLDRYLEVPFDRLEPYVPRWPLTAHVPSMPEGVELLPFVVNELGIVREPRGERLDGEHEEMAAGPTQEAGFVRSAASHRSPVFTPEGEDELAVVDPEISDESIEHAWFGSHAPRGASKAVIDAYRNQLARRERSESIEILLVCNDARMVEEHDVLDGAYGNREELPFDIDSEFGASTDRLATLLADGGYDFLHYIGHATSTGLRCPDGELDVRTLESIDLGVFFLNACQSYEQGLAMVERGAFGGVGTLGDIVNEHAVETGETMARLLNLGFPLRAALELARETTVLGEQYLIVGDGSADIAQTDGGAPTVIELHERSNAYEVAYYTYPTKEFRLGTTTVPTIPDIDQKHLTPGCIRIDGVELDDLENYLMWTSTTLLRDKSLVWNDELLPFHAF